MKIVKFDKIFKTKIKVLNYNGRRYSGNIIDIDEVWNGRELEVTEINLQLDIDDVVLNVSYVSQYERFPEPEPPPNYPGSIQVFHQNKNKRPSNIIVSQMIKEHVIKLVDNIYEKLKLNFMELGEDDDNSIIGYEITI